MGDLAGLSASAQLSIEIAPAPPPNPVLGTGAGREILRGAEGEDRIAAGAGSGDRMTGLGGADQFVFDAADASNGVREVKTILDFDVGADSLALEGGLEIASFRKIGAGAVIEFAGGDRDALILRAEDDFTLADLFRVADAGLFE